MTRTPVSKAPGGTSDGPIRTAVMFVRAVLRRFQVDDATFLAGGVAFNVLLAGIPFVLLLAAGLGFLLRRSPDTVAPAVQGVLANLFPSTSAGGGSILDPVLAEIVRTRAAIGAGGGAQLRLVRLAALRDAPQCARLRLHAWQGAELRAREVD